MARDARPAILRDVVTSRVPSLMMVGTISRCVEVDTSLVLMTDPLLYKVSRCTRSNPG